MTNRAQILSFKLGNYTSFGEEQTIPFSDDMQTTRQVTAIIGYNATGKTNILKALKTLQDMVHDSANAGYILPFNPFLYNTKYSALPTSFEITFRYLSSIFTYSIKYDQFSILLESLREHPENTLRSRLIFERSQKELNPGSINYGFSRTIYLRTRPNTLLITKAAEDNNKYANIVLNTINSFNIVFCSYGNPEQRALELLQRKSSLIPKTLTLLKNADLSISDIQVGLMSFPSAIIDSMNIPNEIKDKLRASPNIVLNLGHTLRNNDGSPVLQNNRHTYISPGLESESIGTRAFLGAIVPILDSIDENKTLFIDEFGTYIHPTLIRKIINDYVFYKDAPGLVICTHAGTFLDSTGRDSIVVLSKDNTNEETKVFAPSKYHIRSTDNLNRKFYDGDSFYSLPNDLPLF